MEKKEVLEQARKKMNGACRVCPICNGVVCKGEIPGFGGLRTGVTFQRNRASLESYGLVMRSMAGAQAPDTTTTLFGQTVSLPVWCAPIGAVAFNIWEKKQDPEAVEKDYVQAITKGAATAGTIGMTGDGAQEFVLASGLQASRTLPGHVVPTIKPREDEAIIERALWAKEAGAPAFAIDIDAATLINMRLLGQPVGPKNQESLRRIAQAVDLPMIVKGIMSAEEAVLCVEAGAAGIVVSNHGGRVMDGMVGTVDVLPEIAAAVKGKLAIGIDGGIRTGEDVLKVLALGADFCLIGRPMAVGAIGGGQDGVALLLQELQGQLKDAMMMAGVSSIQEISSRLVRKIG